VPYPNNPVIAGDPATAAARVEICEVGPRDGLQNHSRQFSVDERIELINRLFAAGIGRVEGVSFVNDSKVPRMAGAEAVVEGVVRRKGQLLSGLVLNRRGAERAIMTSVDEVRFVVVASETFSQRNQGASVEETLRACEDTARAVISAGKRLSVVIATAFGCPFEGLIPAAKMIDIVQRVQSFLPHEIVLADTIGAATPFAVGRLLALVMPLSDAIWGCHFHNTRDMGLANALEAIRTGVTVLDASIGGLGGCPFAPRATGNIATEALVYMLGDVGNPSLPSLEHLLGTVAFLEEKIGGPVPSLLARAGGFPLVSQAAIPDHSAR
jgi:hydroxymethylglutaryl-CoA lyase